MYKTSIVTGILFCALAVILGAFGAHALKEILTPELLNTFETGVRYQFYHGFALLALGLLALHLDGKYLRWAMVCFIIGVLLFSGSIYALVALKSQGQVGLGGVGVLTPIGGLFFILAWIFMLLGSLNLKKKA